MPLHVVATPIGNTQDISLRALDTLKSADFIIVEEFKESTKILRAHGISGKTYLQLNEHSTAEDLQELLEHCKKSQVALITDCGTPGFCDPGAHLVGLCRKENVSVISVPGASSLMTLLSLAGQRINQFYFRGFLPQETQARETEWKKLLQQEQAVIVMDTPYRFRKSLLELKQHLKSKQVLVACNLTQENEFLWEGLAQNIQEQKFPEKAEFLFLIYPK